MHREDPGAGVGCPQWNCNCRNCAGVRNGTLPARLERFRTRAAQEHALAVVQFKLDILWQMNDALALAYGLRP